MLDDDYIKSGEQARRINQSLGFVPLKGTPDQQIHGEVIRRNINKRLLADMSLMDSDIDTIEKFIKSIDDPGWWINRKYISIKQLYNLATKQQEIDHDKK